MVSTNKAPLIIYPELQKLVSNKSKLAQKCHFYLIFLNLALLVTAAFLSKFKIGILDFQFNQTLILICGFSILVYLGLIKPERAWYASRSLSETIKTLSWRFCYKAGPFGNSDETDSSIFAERVRESCMESDSVDGFSAGYQLPAEPTLQMLLIRELTLEEKTKFYVVNRVGSQLSWYKRKAKANKTLAKFIFALSCFVSAGAVVFSYFNELRGNAQLPTDLLIALSSSLIACMQTKKYTELTAAYELTAYEISLARDLVHSLKTSLELERFVNEMENLFSREHTQWTAKRQPLFR
ncbi:DUF4231 domain-containing protein [Pseudomonas sp. ACM7]|uniref:DUF4231 domain-containing protein n=1 Tax=Pseudomonas sp. ACM7 TaxID=2052956 RepID=UPI001013079A|nr:DUF4231 domain-containing protein [Pseudomonas sp. ACM7]QAY94001.1 hypothetical protein CUN63_31200 [Pseudomonas sp. ACM7]